MVKKSPENKIVVNYKKTGIIAAIVIAVAALGVWAVSGLNSGNGAAVSDAIEVVSNDAADASNMRIAVIRMDGIQTEASVLKNLREQKESYENKLREELTQRQKDLEAEKKEIAKNLANSRMILSKAKAQEILSQVGVTDEDIIETVCSDNLDNTIARATALANKFKSVTEETAKKTKEELANLDIKPNPTNIPQGDDVMTLDKFQNLSADEQEKFINEHPEEFENL